MARPSSCPPRVKPGRVEPVRHRLPRLHPRSPTNSDLRHPQVPNEGSKPSVRIPECTRRDAPLPGLWDGGPDQTCTQAPRIWKMG